MQKAAAADPDAGLAHVRQRGQRHRARFRVRSAHIDGPVQQVRKRQLQLVQPLGWCAGRRRGLPGVPRHRRSGGRDSRVGFMAHYGDGVEWAAQLSGPLAA